MTATDPGRVQACAQADTTSRSSAAGGTWATVSAPGSARSEEAGRSSGAMTASSDEA